MEKSIFETKDKRMVRTVLNLRLKRELREAFKAACEANGSTMTKEIIKFIKGYIERNGK